MQLGIQAVGSGAAQQIHFVGTCGGDEQLRIPDTGLQQRFHGCTVAVNRHHVVLFLAGSQNPRIDVDEGDVVTFGGQQTGQSGADLAVTGDDDIHKSTSSWG